MMLFGLFPFAALIFFLLVVRGIGNRVSRSGGRTGGPSASGVPSCKQVVDRGPAGDERANRLSEADIFRLADTKDGVLTLSDVVVGLGYGLKESERMMDGLVDGTHVRMEVDDDGNVRYEFPEIVHRRPSASVSLP